jgi:hypothetical protein
VTRRAGADHVEPGSSWRPLRLVAGVLGLAAALDLALPGPGVPAPVQVPVAAAVLGVVAAGVVSARRARTVRVDVVGAEPALSVGPERVPLADVDAAHLRAVLGGTAGADAGAPLLGGTASLPRGWTDLPLRLTDGRTVRVPTRDPAALGAVLVSAVTGAGGDGPAREGTLGS